jgi:hypothetical protein
MLVSVVSASYAALVTFLIIAALALILGVMLIFSLRRWLANLRWPAALVFLLSMGAGAVAARGSYAHPKPSGSPDIFTITIVVVNFPFFAASVWRFFAARRVMGPRLYVFPRPWNLELTWSGRAVMLMAVLFFLLVLRLALWAGWVGAVVVGAGAMVACWMGYQIAESLGRVELRGRGVLTWGVFHPWAELGRFEWMPGSPPVLRIQLPRKHSDIRVSCPDDAEINALLTTRGLIPL